MARKASSDQQLLFTVHRSVSQGGYHHLEIQVVQESVSRDHICQFTWQADRNTDYWYAFAVQIHCETGEHLKRATGVATRIMRDLWDPQPSAVLDRLRKVGARLSVYDSRVSQYVPVSEVLPPTIRRWVDDHQTLRHNSCNASVLAGSEEDAQREIAKQLLDQSDGEALLREFLDAGRPVVIAYGDTPPEVPDLEETLRLDWVRPEEPMAAAA